MQANRFSLRLKRFQDRGKIQISQEIIVYKLRILLKSEKLSGISPSNLYLNLMPNQDQHVHDRTKPETPGKNQTMAGTYQQ
jgi:hypothetical protein